MDQHYDEYQELYRYVSFNRQELLTPLERRAEWLATLREKVRLCDNNGVHKALVAKYEAAADEHTLQLIGDGPDGLRAFQDRVARRIETEIAGGVIVINRCPSCNRIVKTPLARQCLWCGHDWHYR